MSINLLIYVIYQSVGRATEKAWKRVNYYGWTATVMYTNGTAIKFSERYLPKQPALDVSRYAREIVPVRGKYGAVFAYARRTLKLSFVK